MAPGCSICQEPFQEEDDGLECISTCGHVYHALWYEAGTHGPLTSRPPCQDAECPPWPFPAGVRGQTETQGGQSAANLRTTAWWRESAFVLFAACSNGWRCAHEISTVRCAGPAALSARLLSTSTSRTLARKLRRHQPERRERTGTGRRKRSSHKTKP